jgi:hypothetical protein
MNSVLFIKENGHSGRCPICGQVERFIEIEHESPNRKIQVNSGLSCFLKSVFLQGRVLTLYGLDPTTFFVVKQ